MKILKLNSIVSEILKFPDEVEDCRWQERGSLNFEIEQ